MADISIMWEIDDSGIVISVSGISTNPVKGKGGKRKEDSVFFSFPVPGSPHPDHIVFAAILSFYPFIPNDSTIICQEPVSEDFLKSLRHEKLLGNGLKINPVVKNSYIPADMTPVHSIGGGFDSLAARILYPEFSGYHLKPSLRNIKQMDWKLDPSVHIVSSNLQYIQEGSSMPHFAAMLGGAMISASILSKSGIITGSNANGIFLENGNIFRGQKFNLWYGVFRTIGMPVIPVVSGFSRLATALLSHKHGRIDEAVWCPIGHGNCGECLKCLRSLTSTYLMGASGKPDFDFFFNSERLIRQMSGKDSGYKIELRYLLHSSGAKLPDNIAGMYLPEITSDLLWKVNPVPYPGKFDFSILGGSESVLQRIEDSGMSIMSEEEVKLFESLGTEIESEMMRDCRDDFSTSIERDERVYSNFAELVFIDSKERPGSKLFDVVTKNWEGLWPRLIINTESEIKSNEDFVSESNNGKFRCIRVSHDVEHEEIEKIVSSCPKSLIILPISVNHKNNWRHFISRIIEKEQRVLLYDPDVEEVSLKTNLVGERFSRLNHQKCREINKLSGLID